jgi:hypothetical protein
MLVPHSVDLVMQLWFCHHIDVRAVTYCHLLSPAVTCCCVLRQVGYGLPAEA